MSVSARANPIRFRSSHRASSCTPLRTRSDESPMKAGTCMASPSRPSWDETRQPWQFCVGDGIALTTSSVIAALAMLAVHLRVGNMALASIAGMGAAMVTTAAFTSLAAVALGSIETKVPAMLISMISPMLVCGVGALGGADMSAAQIAAAAASLGPVMAIALAAYGHKCRRAFARGDWYR